MGVLDEKGRKGQAGGKPASQDPICERCGRKIAMTDVQRPGITPAEYAREPHVEVNHIGPIGYSVKITQRHISCDSSADIIMKELAEKFLEIYANDVGGDGADEARKVLDQMRKLWHPDSRAGLRE